MEKTEYEKAASGKLAAGDSAAFGGTVSVSSSVAQTFQEVKGEQAFAFPAQTRTLAAYYLLRVQMGTPNDGAEVVHEVWPDCPMEDQAALSQWLLVHPEVKALMLTLDPHGPPPDDTPVGSTWEDLGALPVPIKWAWPNWLPCGFLSMLLADQDMGKSQVLLRTASCFLRGDPWPDTTLYTGDLCRVLWCEAESSQGLNYARAREWGLPLDRIVSPLSDPLDDVLLDDPDHLQAIENHASRPDIGFVAVDSLTGASRRDMNDARMFHVVKALADLAKNVKKPVQLSHHIRKLTLLDEKGVVTLQQGRGSGAIFQPARAVWAIDAPDPRDEETRRLAVIKNNITGKRSAAPLGFVIDGDGPRFLDYAPSKPIQSGPAEQAEDLLLSLLHGGPMKATELQSEYEQAGISVATVNRVKEKLGIVSVRKGTVWYWSLPAKE